MRSNDNSGPRTKLDDDHEQAATPNDDHEQAATEDSHQQAADGDHQQAADDSHQQTPVSGGDDEAGSESRDLPDSLDWEAARAQLYDVMDDESLSLPEKRSLALEIGRRYLELENGHVQRIDGDIHEVVASVGGPPELLPEGERLPAGQMYCRRTIQQDSALALSDARQQGWESDPAYEEHGFDCYLGASVVVDGNTYGTVCFVSRKSRSSAFTEDERTFVELVARLLKRELEASNYRAALDKESRQRQREARLRSGMFAAAPDAILVVDETDEIVEANARAASLTGYTESELVGRSLRDLCTHEDWEQYATALQQAIEHDGTVDTFSDGQPLKLRRVDGPDAVVDISADAVTIDGERYRQLVLRDATERVRRERLIRVLNRVVRHNLRNDLNVIQGYAQSFVHRTGGEMPPELDKVIDTAAGLVEMTETARQLETLADEDREPQPTRVVPAVQEAAAAVRESYSDATVEVASVVDADRAALATDRLRDVVAELIENAVVHTDAATAHVRIAPQTDDDGLHVHVTDEGDGLPEQDRRVLTGGEETKLDHASSLGVWLVAWLVDEFGGRVDVRESDTGTTVTVTLLPVEA